MALGSVAHRSPFAEACLILSLPSVCSVRKNRVSYYVITWYVLHAPPAADGLCVCRSLLTYIA